MKNLLLSVAVFAIFSLSACGQTSKEVPSGVQSSFSQKFPNTTKVKWDKENEKEWEAEFKMDGKEYSANFDVSGAWMETEYEISLDEIPAAVKTSLDNEFAGYKIEASEISQTSEGTLYEFELKKDGEEMEAAIDMNGMVQKKEQAQEEDENEEED